MEMPVINLAHADLNKYNQTPNHLANHHLWIDFVFRGKVLIYIYIYTFGISRKPLKVQNIIYFHFDFHFA